MARNSAGNSQLEIHSWKFTTGWYTAPVGCVSPVALLEYTGINSTYR